MVFRKVGRNVLLSTSSRPGRPPPGQVLQGSPEPESQIPCDRPYPPWVARRRSLTWRRSLGREHPWCPRRMREWFGGMGEGEDVREGKTTRPRARWGSPLRAPPLIHRCAPPLTLLRCRGPGVCNRLPTRGPRHIGTLSRQRRRRGLRAIIVLLRPADHHMHRQEGLLPARLRPAGRPRAPRGQAAGPPRCRVAAPPTYTDLTGAAPCAGGSASSRGPPDPPARWHSIRRWCVLFKTK